MYCQPKLLKQSSKPGERSIDQREEDIGLIIKWLARSFEVIEDQLNMYANWGLLVLFSE